MHIKLLNGKFAVQCTIMENHRAQGMPQRTWRKQFKMWACPATYDNARYILKAMRREEVTDEAWELAQKLVADVTPAAISDVLPARALEGLLPHQTHAIERAWVTPSFGILHRPRLRKTATTIRLACARYMAGQIDKLVVFVPNPIRHVWKREFGLRAVCPYDLHVYDSDKKKAFVSWLNSPLDGLRVLVVGTESMSSVGAHGIVAQFLEGDKKRNMAAVDESTRIANHKSGRTKAIWLVGDEMAHYKNILTGSEVTRNIENIFAQFRFLGVHTLGNDSFYAWRNEYCLMGGYEKKKIVGMRNGDALLTNMAKYSDLVKTTDVVAMPEKTFTHRVVPPSAEQAGIIKDLQKALYAEFEGREIDVEHAMVAQLRAIQVAGGHFPAANEDGSTELIPLNSNPKLDELMFIVQEEQGKVVIWARFQREIELIRQSLADAYGEEAVVTFYGLNDDKTRAANVMAFQTDDRVRYIVANPQVGGMGQEMSAADLMVWYSQDFNYESRIQALERCTNLEKLVGIGVVDLVLDVKCDWNVFYSNEGKKDLAEFIEDAIHSRKFELA